MYRHTQIGWAFLSACGLALLFIATACGLLLVRGPDNAGPALALLVPVFLVLFSILFLFGSLTVSVDDECVEASFGPGLIRKRIWLADVESCRAVRNPWFVGWGIRWLPGCWVYNVSGFDAVEVAMKNRKRYRIGTDEPDRLNSLIQRKIEDTARR